MLKYLIGSRRSDDVKNEQLKKDATIIHPSKVSLRKGNTERQRVKSIESIVMKE